MNKQEKYESIVANITALIEGEDDAISIYATVACELFTPFDYFNWVGFYRRVNPTTLKVGPYQGGHGCLTIDIERGVCGKCLREDAVQIENDVQALPHHIACSSQTQAEMVLPVHNANGDVIAVLDVDCVVANCFDEVDAQYLARIVTLIEAHVG